MKYLHELSRRNVAVGVLVLLILGLTRPTLDQKHVFSSVKKASTLVVGIDVSHHQGVIDWQKVKNSDEVHFAFVKATEGVNYIDPLSKQNAASLRKTSLPFGNYHFFHPNEDSEQQAKFFLKNMSKPLILPPVLDVEITQSIAPAKLQQKVNAWLTLVEKETGCTPIVYTDLSFWQSYLSKGFQNYPLWLAEYRSDMYIPPDMKRWSIWQKTDRGTVSGISGNVDLNQLNHHHTSLESLKC